MILHGGPIELFLIPAIAPRLIYQGPRYVLFFLLNRNEIYLHGSLMVQWVDWCNKDHDMCYPVCGMVHIKEPLLLIGKSNPCDGSMFPLTI